MKNKRLLIFSVIIIALISIAAGLFASCANNTETDTDNIIISITKDKETGNISVDVTTMGKNKTFVTDKSYLGEALKDLKSEGLIELEYSDGAYGMFITSINGKTLAANEFVGIYLSSDDAANADLLIPTVTRGETTYYSANKGADTLPLIDGVSYLLTIVVF